jgi:Copper type II ascorbate-dependent monooxygenase, C-terminal domain
MPPRPLALPAVLALFAAACGAPPGTSLPPPDSGSAAEPDSGTIATTTSYLRDIQPLVERSCASCHSTGGVAPFALETPQQAIMMAGAMWSSIKGARMPPFYASADCNSYQDDDRLSAAEKATFEAWVNEGAPLGDAAEERHATVKSLPTIRKDKVMSAAAPFDARLMNGKADNYRCFELDPGVTVDQKVSGYEVIPGNKAILHHLLAYTIPPEQLDQLKALDDASPGEGYDCIAGGIGIQGAIQNQIAGWVPGASPSKLPPGTGLLLKAGSRIVMQVHYNLNKIAPGDSALDQTQLALEMQPASELATAQVFPAVKLNLNIKAGDANSVQTAELPALGPYAGATIYNVTGHMHQLAKGVRFEITKKDGTSQCLLDIPDWDFNWQRAYTLSTPYTIKSGDKLKITCTYDNSALNQPYVNGVQQVPRDVQWGETTADEMCMTYMTFTK